MENFFHAVNSVCPTASRMRSACVAPATSVISPVTRPSCITRIRSLMPSTSGSSELIIRMAMSDRILVMNEGRVTGEITDVAQATQEDIMNLATSRETLAA